MFPQFIDGEQLVADEYDSFRVLRPSWVLFLTFKLLARYTSWLVFLLPSSGIPLTKDRNHYLVATHGNFIDNVRVQTPTSFNCKEPSVLINFANIVSSATFRPFSDEMKTVGVCLEIKALQLSFFHKYRKLHINVFKICFTFNIYCIYVIIENTQVQTRN